MQIEELLEALAVGDTMLVSARPVEGDKIHLEFAERVSNPNSGNSALGLFNKSDDRFNVGGARRAWLTADAEDAMDLIGDQISVNLLELEEEVNIGVTNLMVGDHRLRLQVTETLEGSEWQADNLSQSCKQNGDGKYLLSNSKPIYSNTSVVVGDPQHTFIQHDEVVVTLGVTADASEIVEDVEVLATEEAVS